MPECFFTSAGLGYSIEGHSVSLNRCMIFQMSCVLKAIKQKMKPELNSGPPAVIFKPSLVS